MIVWIVMSKSLIMGNANHCRVHKIIPVKERTIRPVSFVMDQGLTQKICFFQTHKTVKINFCVNQASND